MCNCKSCCQYSLQEVSEVLLCLAASVSGKCWPEIAYGSWLESPAETNQVSERALWMAERSETDSYTVLVTQSPLMASPLLYLKQHLKTVLSILQLLRLVAGADRSLPFYLEERSALFAPQCNQLPH